MRIENFKHIESARKHSEDRLERLRQELSPVSELKGCAVVVAGSYARKEANDQSDCDYFIIAPEQKK